jgi:hypothetical protein
MIKSVKNGKIVIPIEYLSLESLESLKQGQVFKIPVEIDGFEGYSLEIQLNMDFKIKNTYSKIIKNYSYIEDILKNNKQISWGILNYSEELLIILSWIYSVYLKYSVIIFLPDKVPNDLIDSAISKFNDQFEESFSLNQVVLLQANMINIENFEILNKKKTSFISWNTDMIFNDLINLNKRRLLTQFKKIIKKCCSVQILSITDMKIFDIPFLKDFIDYRITSQYHLESIVETFHFVDLLDYDNQFDHDVLVELIVESVKKENKTFYLLLDLEIDQLKNVERLLIEQDIKVARNESESDCDVVINSCKKGFNVFLTKDYSCYVILPPVICNSVEILYYLKYLKCLRNQDSLIYIESSRVNNIQRNINKILNIPPNELKFRIKDSDYVFESYTDALNDLNQRHSIIDPIMASDHYIRTEYSSIKNFDNIPKETYEQIRNFVKFKVEHKINIEIKTCQLSTPCSPKDRSKKLNSLANKISSFNYRCEVSCELFKDSTIGIVLWNEMFSRRNIKMEYLLKNKAFVYQNTMGKWKYSLIS